MKYTTPPTLIAEGVKNEELFEVYKTYYFIIDAVFCLPTIFGNLLIIIVIAKFSILRKSTSSVLICNLAVSDLLVGVVVFPVHMLLLKYDGVSRSQTFCLLHHSLVYTLVGTSVMNLFLLSLERVHALTRPFRHVEVFTKRRMFIAIAVTWVCMFSYGFLPLFGWHQAVDDNVPFTCLVSPLLSDVYVKIICVTIAVTMFINSVFFVVISYVAIKAVKGLNEHHVTGNHHVTEDNHVTYDNHVADDHDARTRRDVRHTRTMLLVSGLFVVFWAPFCVLTLVPRPSDALRLVTAWCGSLGLVNSAVNWLVYGVRSEKFRIAFKAVLTGDYDGAKSEISNLIT